MSNSIAARNTFGLRSKNGASQNRHGAASDANKIHDSVIRIARHIHATESDVDHPAMFPVALPAFIMQCWPRDVYEPFSGSGTTIVAAEQMGKRCFAMEIAPKYVDVAVKRWEKLTGRKAEKINERKAKRTRRVATGRKKT